MHRDDNGNLVDHFDTYYVDSPETELCAWIKHRQYDDSDILSSSSSLNKSYPEFYGDQCLS